MNPLPSAWPQPLLGIAAIEQRSPLSLNVGVASLSCCVNTSSA